MHDVQLVALVLAALFVGAVIPVLLQLRVTLRAAEVALKETMPRVEHTIDATSKLLADATQVMERMQSATRIFGAIGSAIGPALVAGLSSYRARHDASAQDTPETTHGSTEEQA